MSDTKEILDANEASDTRKGTNPLILTFGVEIEHLCGIKQDEVKANQEHEWLHEDVHPAYHSESDEPEDKRRRENLHLRRRGLRQATRIIRNRGVDLQVKEDPDPRDKPDEYRGWNLTYDIAVPMPTDANQLWEWSKSEGEVKIDDTKEWQIVGLELISPPLIAPQVTSGDLQSDELDQVTKYLGAIPTGRDATKPYFFTTGPEIGSVHVHIGMHPGTKGKHVDSDSPQPDAPRRVWPQQGKEANVESEQHHLPFSFLQHLAFICITFEDAITLLHHPERHGYQDSKIFKHCKSNRDVVRSAGSISHRCPLGPAYSCEKAFIDIFRAEDRLDLHKILNIRPEFEETVRTDLGELPEIGPRRERFVNFTNALDNEFGTYLKRTVEFRQHHGTLSAERVCEWIAFVTALARTAERKANETASQDVPLPPFVTEATLADSERSDIEKEVKKYPGLFQSAKKRTLEELFDLMELPSARRKYWWAQAEANRKLWAEKYKSRSTCTPPCDVPPTRDCEGWDDTELVVPDYSDDDDEGDGDDAETAALSGPPSTSPTAGSKRKLEEDEDEDEDEGERPLKKQELDNDAPNA